MGGLEKINCTSQAAVNFFKWQRLRGNQPTNTRNSPYCFTVFVNYKTNNKTPKIAPADLNLYLEAVIRQV